MKSVTGTRANSSWGSMKTTQCLLSHYATKRWITLDSTAGDINQSKTRNKNEWKWNFIRRWKESIIQESITNQTANRNRIRSFILLRGRGRRERRKRKSREYHRKPAESPHQSSPPPKLRYIPKKYLPKSWGDHRDPKQYRNQLATMILEYNNTKSPISQNMTTNNH